MLSLAEINTARSSGVVARRARGVISAYAGKDVIVCKHLLFLLHPCALLADLDRSRTAGEPASARRWGNVEVFICLHEGLICNTCHFGGFSQPLICLPDSIPTHCRETPNS